MTFLELQCGATRDRRVVTKIGVIVAGFWVTAIAVGNFSRLISALVPTQFSWSWTEMWVPRKKKKKPTIYDSWPSISPPMVPSPSVQ
jgi:hypothetical protein